MSRLYRTGFLAVFIIALVVILGCASEDKSPKGAVLRFIDAARVRDIATIDKVLFYQRLAIEKEGEAYLNMSATQAGRLINVLRKNLLSSIGSGPLSKLGTIAVRIKSETIKGERAEVVIYDEKNKYETYSFLLAFDGGAWKIYKITHL